MVCKPGLLRHSLLWLATCCTLYSGLAHGSLAGIGPGAIGLPISQILISGNNKTQGKYIIQWSGLEEGQILTIPLLRHAEQELRDTDLFREIDFQVEHYENGEMILHILLRERKFWLLLPRVSRNGDGDVKAGMRLRMYNLNGADQTLEVLAQQEEESNGDDSEEYRIKYSLPLFTKPYDLTWRLNHIIKNTEVDDFDNIETVDFFSMSVSRDWHVDSFKVPLTLETTIAFEKRELDEPYPDDLEAREAGNYNRLRLELIFDDVHNERYRRFGSYYSFSIAQGVDWLDSDYDSTVFGILAMRFNRLNRYDNFNYRVVFAVADEAPFDYSHYGIGGASNLRGLESVDDRGDAVVFTNLEYIVAYRKRPGLRHTLFVDVGNVYEDLSAIDLGDLHYTVGTGFRWKIESFVKTDLFLDYGYDIEEGAGKLYGGTTLAF
jgi:outer membrane protein assembly factor BamA